MKRTPIRIDPDRYPEDLRPLLCGAEIYDSSCSSEAQVIYIARDAGYFLKVSQKGSLSREYAMAQYFHAKGLGVPALAYHSTDRDYLLTERAKGEDCTAACYLENPARLAETTATLLRALHETDYLGCPVSDRNAEYLETVSRNYRRGQYDPSYFGGSLAMRDADAIYRFAVEGGRALKSEVLLHGDYCLPNTVLDDWRFSAFIDVGNGGVGDRHIDLFWGVWTLAYNLGTDKYADRFLDAYGREKVDSELLLAVSAAECFG